MSDNDYLKMAIQLANDSPEEIGCGCVIISKDGEVLSSTFSSQKTDQQAVNHAEVKAVQSANTKTGSRKLDDATAYCSCEPCAMCLVALSYAKVKRIVYAKSMLETFPDDPQSQLDAEKFVKGLNFVPQLEKLVV